MQGRVTAQASSVVTDWNAQALQAIRTTHPGPPQVARMLAVTNTAMYDAWAAYDGKANGTQIRGELRRPHSEHDYAHRREAVSYAAHRALVDLFPTEKASFDAQMVTLGYDPNDNYADLTTPVGVEPGLVPAQDITLSWPTFSAGRSVRRPMARLSITSKAGQATNRSTRSVHGQPRKCGAVFLCEVDGVEVAEDLTTITTVLPMLRRCNTRRTSSDHTHYFRGEE